MAPPQKPYRDQSGNTDEIFSYRYEKSASALIALHDVIDQYRPLQNPEESAFLASYRWIHAQPVEAFSEVWLDPTSYWWVRTAYHLLATVMNEAPLSEQTKAYLEASGPSSPISGLTEILCQFQRFAIGTAIHAHEALELSIPLPVELPFAIPGTPWNILGKGPIRITGVDKAGLQIQGSSRALEMVPEACAELGGEILRTLPSPSVTVGHHTLALNPYLFYNLPGLEFIRRALDGVDLSFQERMAGWVEQALRLISRYHPAVSEQLLDNTYAIALKPLSQGGFTNITYSDLPGTFLVGLTQDPYELADTLIHEYHHNRLFFVEEGGPFFAEREPDPIADCSFYSPWRDDPRPLHGILHGAYVYTPVNEFWLNALQDNALDPKHRDYAIDRLLRGIMQVRLGLQQLQRHAALTPQGEAVITDIGGRLEAAEAATEGLGLSSENPARLCSPHGEIEPELHDQTGTAMSIGQSLRRHVERFAPSAEKTALLATVDHWRA